MPNNVNDVNRLIDMAVSASAETVCISPYEIENNKETQDKEYVARGLARILEIDEDTILEKMGKTDSQYVELKKKVEQKTADEVRRFINGEIDDEGNAITTVNAAGKTVLISDSTKSPTKLHGIFLNADSKRYYPYGTLASQVIGFVGSDNAGLYGLEAKYDDVLEGTSGLTVTAKTNTGEDMLYQYEQYYDAKNGDSLMTTIDVSVQSCLEKGIESMFIIGTGVTVVVLGWRQMLAGEFAHLYVYLFALVFGLIGFVDDYRKVRHHQNEGLTAKQKFVLQLAAAVVFLCLMRYERLLTNKLYIPFANVTLTVNWIVYLIFAAFVIVGCVNAVNLTDGIDGLATSVTFVVMAFFTAMAMAAYGMLTS